MAGAQPLRRRVRADGVHADPAGPRGGGATVIETLPVGDDSPLARLDGLHFSRLQIFRELVHQGDKQRKRDHLRSSHLVFTSTFDGELEPYLDAICAVRAPRPTSGGGTAPAIRARADRAAFKRYIRDHQTDTSLFASAHPDARVARRAREPRAARADRRLRGRCPGSRRRGPAGRLPGAVHALMRLGRPPNLPRRRSSAARVDLADIQGNVLRGYSYPKAAYVFVRIVDPDRARALMVGMLPQVATAEPWTDGPPDTALHVAFTARRAVGARGAGSGARLVPGRVPRGHGGARRAARRPRAERARALGRRPRHGRGARAHHDLRRRRRAARRGAGEPCAVWVPRARAP